MYVLTAETGREGCQMILRNMQRNKPAEMQADTYNKKPLAHESPRRAPSFDTQCQN